MAKWKCGQVDKWTSGQVANCRLHWNFNCNEIEIAAKGKATTYMTESRLSKF